MSGQRKSFQVLTNVRIATTPSAGPDERQDDAVEDAEFRSAVDAGGVHKLIRHRFNVLSHKENVKSDDDARHNDRPIGVDPAKIDHHQKQRDQQHLKWQRQGRQHQEEKKRLKRNSYLAKAAPANAAK